MASKRKRLAPLVPQFRMRECVTVNGYEGVGVIRQIVKPDLHSLCSDNWRFRFVVVFADGRTANVGAGHIRKAV